MSETAPFEISFDLASGTIRSTLRHFWTAEIFASFEREMNAIISKVRDRHTIFALLSDCTQYPVQTLDIVEAFKSIGGPEAFGGPSAYIVGSTLAKMQAERVLANPNIRVFTDGAMAETWLQDTLRTRREEHR